jgi:hypothetical protein
MHSNTPLPPKHFLQQLHNLWTEAVGKGGYIFFFRSKYNILSAVTELKDIHIM